MKRLTVEDLILRSEIADTLHDYSRGVDRVDIDLLSDVFTEDASFDYGHGQVTRGRAALRDLFRAATGRYTATSHHCSTITYLDLSATAASTITYVYAFHDNAEQDLHLHVWGNYEDVLVNEGDRWRISARKVRIAGVRSTSSEEIPERFERYVRGTP